MTVSWQGVVGPTASDWIGLYTPGMADTAGVLWLFDSSCTQSVGTAKASGSCSVTMPLTAGTYEFRLFKNNGYTKLATSGQIAVTAPTSGGPTLTAPSSAAAGTSVTVAWSSVASPKVKDWIGLFTVGSSDLSAVNWMFTSSCTQTAGTTGKASGSCSITLPMTLGTYEFRLFADNSYTRLATSGQVSVTAAAPTATVSATPATVAKGASASVAWSGVASPTKVDWLGVYMPGAGTTSTAINWIYTSSCTQTAGSTAKASGTCSLKMPSTAGTYEIRLYANNSYTVLAKSSAITVS